MSLLACSASPSDDRRTASPPGCRIGVVGSRFYCGESPVYLFGQGYELAIDRQSTYMGFDYRHEADWYARFGLNFTRFYPLIVKDFGQDFAVPFVRLPSGKFDLTDYDPEYFPHLRSVCQYYGRKGIVCLLQFWHWPFLSESDTGSWDRCVYNPANNVNRFTSGIARGDTDFAIQALRNRALLAHQLDFIDRILDATADLGNVIYEIAHEYWNAPYSPEASLWVETIVKHVRDYERKKGTRIVLGNMPATARELDRELALPGIDFVDLAAHPEGIHHQSPEHIYLIFRNLHSSGKALIAGVIYPSPDVRENRETVRLENQRRFWAVFMAGGSGATTAVKLVLPFSHYRLERAYEDSDDWERYISYLHRFLAVLKHPEKLEPAEALAEDIWLLEAPGEEYVAYLSAGNEVFIDLSASTGRLAYRWYDPRRGSFEESWWVPGKYASEFVCPWTGDAVLHIWKP